MNKHHRMIKSILVLGLLSIITLISLVPFFWMITTSLKSSGALMSIPIQWIPETISWQSYIKVFNSLNFLRSIMNSVFITFSSTALTLFSASLAAFIFAKFDFKFKNPIFLIYIATMMIPIQVTGIPMFIVMSRLGLTNSYLGVIFPAIFNVFAIFLLRQYMMKISSTYVEAAIMDGASMFQVYWKIMMPMSIVPLTTLFVINFMNYWNDYYWPLILLSDQTMMTFPVLLSKMNAQYGTEYNTLMAGSLISMIPILLVYIFAQKHFIRAIQEGGIK